MSDWTVIFIIIVCFAMVIVTYIVGYDSGYKVGKEYQRKEIEDILKMFKGE